MLLLTGTSPESVEWTAADDARVDAEWDAPPVDMMVEGADWRNDPEPGVPAWTLDANFEAECGVSDDDVGDEHSGDEDASETGADDSGSGSDTGDDSGAEGTDIA